MVWFLHFVMVCLLCYIWKKNIVVICISFLREIRGYLKYFFVVFFSLINELVTFVNGSNDLWVWQTWQFQSWWYESHQLGTAKPLQFMLNRHAYKLHNMATVREWPYPTTVLSEIWFQVRMTWIFHMGGGVFRSGDN